MKNKPRSPFSDNTDFAPMPNSPALPQADSKIGQRIAAQLPLFQNDLLKPKKVTENNVEITFKPEGFKSSFKDSEVGIIPIEWFVKPLCKVAEIRSGFAKNSNVLVNDPIQVHYLRVANVQDGFLNLSEMSQIQISRSDLNRFTVLPGDVLMNEGGDLDKLGRGAIWRGQFSPCIHQNHVFVVRCGQQIIPEYLNTWTSSKVARRYFLLTGKQTTNLASINKTSLGQLPIALPCMEEQRAIAEALSDVDALLDSLDRLITKKRDIKQAAMQQLLTSKTRLPDFDGEWEVKRLGDVVQTDPENLGSDTSPDWSFNYIALEDVDTGFLKSWSELFYLNAPSRARRRLRNNDILVSTVRPNLQSHLLFQEKPGNWVCSTGFCVLRCQEKITNPSFIFFQLFSDCVKRQIDTLLTGSNYPAINSGDVRALEIPIPNYKEQVAIACVLSDMDAELESLEQRREKTRAIKQGMMQELLTGRTRLI